jgi:Ser/Thr protein kinase RdoA (MazF antagonist)
MPHSLLDRSGRKFDSARSICARDVKIIRVDVKLPGSAACRLPSCKIANGFRSPTAALINMDQADHDQQLIALQAAAEAAIEKYELPSGSTAVLVNLSENATYRIDDPSTGHCWALRIHRVGYHSRDAIASELAWLTALRNDGAVITPRPVKGRDGELVQVVSVPMMAQARHAVLFDWESGVEPTENDPAVFEILGETTARMHAHARAWRRPQWFVRHTWDFETSLGSRPHWGSWLDGIGVTPEKGRLLTRTVECIRQRLERFGKGPNRFGLIHCDMRLANILLDGLKIKVIDFDDCGFSWLLYDCATAVSFFEHKAEVPALLDAWTRGYRRRLELAPDDELEIPTFVMLRRLLLVAWIGSHAETDLAKSMGEQYTDDTLPLCDRYLSSNGRAVA